MEAALDGVALAVFGRSRTISIATAKCVACGGEAREFRDELSAKEYSLSGMCQACQDKMFGPGEGYVNQG
jgi:uncharacterized CHY-type Zn-finger protein